MTKKYKNCWDSKKMNINFTQKQWRQDFASYVREKLFWDMAMVTRSTIVKTNNKNEKIKEFSVYNNYGRNIDVKFKNENIIISSTHLDLVNKYLEERNVF